jgi:hypothetical protein
VKPQDCFVPAELVDVSDELDEAELLSEEPLDFEASDPELSDFAACSPLPFSDPPFRA